MLRYILDYHPNVYFNRREIHYFGKKKHFDLGEREAEQMREKIRKTRTRLEEFCNNVLFALKEAEQRCGLVQQQCDHYCSEHPHFILNADEKSAQRKKKSTE